MKRTPVRPSTRPISRGAPPKREARLQPGTPPKVRRVPKRFAKRRDPEYCAWIRTLPCAVPALTVEIALERNMNRQRPRWLGCWPDDGRMIADMAVGFPVAECAHVKARACGGDDRGNTVPLCMRHHRQQHAIGIQTFQALYGFDLAELAERLSASYRPPPETAW